MAFIKCGPGKCCGQCQWIADYNAIHIEDMEILDARRYP